jgi:predicted transcriptional regulator of viral defense system
MKESKKRVYTVFKEARNFATTSEILASGAHPRDIAEVYEEGKIVRVKRGLYRRADIPIISHQSFIDIAQAVPEGVICLLSALSYYELTTFTPPYLSIALRRGSRKPKISYPPVEIHHFSELQYSYGIKIITLSGHLIKIYSREKTLADCLRYRNRIGIDMVKEGLAEYLKRKDRNLEELMECARICRVHLLLHTWLTAIL